MANDFSLAVKYYPYMHHNPNTDFEDILISQYQQGEDLVRILREIKLENFLSRVFGHLEKEHAQSSAFGLETYTALILHECNQKLLQIPSLTERLMIKTVLAEFFQAFISTLVKPFAGRPSRFISAVKITCEVHNYNYDDAYQYLRLYELDKTFGAEELPQQFPPSDIRYAWLNSENDLSSFIADMQLHDIFFSKREMLTLFDPEATQRRVRANEKKELEIALIFELLYKHKVISIKGRNGKFVPLTNYVVDKEGNHLFEVPPFRMIERAKRNSADFEATQRKLLSWLRPYLNVESGKVLVKDTSPQAEKNS